MQVFLWPWVLALLLVLPVLLRLYLRGLRKPARAVVVHPDLALLATATARGRRWPRHLPAALYLGACVVAVVALARPTLPIPEAHPGAGIVLAIDTSGSMRTQDIEPSRFEAAREALRTFVEGLPEGARIGLVTFAGYATLAVPLTDDHERILRSVGLLQMNRGTAIGEGLLRSLEALPALEDREALGDPERFATIILLSDGRNRNGVSPLRALEEVKAQRVTVHTIGIGTNEGGGSFAFPDEGFGFGGARRFDEATLRAIAEETGGRYVFVDSAGELRDVYRELGRSLMWSTRRDEVTALGALAAAALLVFSLGLGELRRQVA